MIIAIDGPAGVGKSTVARELARLLGFRFLDTGAMYRAATLAALRAGLDLQDEGAVANLVRSLRMELVAQPTDDDSEKFRTQTRILVNDENVSEAIRTAQVDANVSQVSSLAAVRDQLTIQQRQVGSAGKMVCEGRDMGTVVFPNAPLKIFLVADAQERARRRALQNTRARGTGTETEPDPEEVQTMLRNIEERDRRDSTRAVAPLRAASDAIHVDTTHLTVDEVLGRVEELTRERLNAAAQAAPRPTNQEI